MFIGCFRDDGPIQCNVAATADDGRKTKILSIPIRIGSYRFDEGTDSRKASPMLS